MTVEILNCDCMDYMKTLEDNAFDLAICDPPYGIDVVKMGLGKGVGTDKREWISKEWDNKTPNKGYFIELKRVSKNQIIWGANYFICYLENSNCMLTWDKMQEFSGAVFELAWTSFNTPSKSFRMSRAEAYTRQMKIHPTQKPVQLYKWLLTNYAKEGDKILDTHLGSGSSAIAAHYLDFDFVGMELDKDYYKKAVERFEKETRQIKLL